MQRFKKKSEQSDEGEGEGGNVSEGGMSANGIYAKVSFSFVAYIRQECRSAFR